MAKEMTAAEMARRRWRGTTAAERTEMMTEAGAKGGASAWAKMSPEERSAEMKRRAAKRKKVKKAR